MLGLALTFLVMALGVTKGIEKMNKVMMPVFFLFFIILLILSLIHIFASHTISKIKGDAVVLRNVYSQEEKEIGGFDTVIIAAQSRSDNDLYKELKAAGRDVRAVGAVSYTHLDVYKRQS